MSPKANSVSATSRNRVLGFSGRRCIWRAQGVPTLVLALVLTSICPMSSAEIRHVSPHYPAAADEGAGHVTRPYRTVAYGVSQLQPGDTLRIAAGTYRESIRFPQRAWSVATPTTVEAVGKVTLLGTDIVNGWRPYGHERSGIFVRRDWHEEPQQVLVNGKPLKQIGGTIFDGFPKRPAHELAALHPDEGGIWPTRQIAAVDRLPPNSFYYDAPRRELLIRADARALRDKAVEVAVRRHLVLGDGVHGVTVKGIRFRYSNTSTVSRRGTVTLAGNGNTLVNIAVEDADGAGIEIAGDRNRILDSTVTRSGYLGIKARGSKNLIRGNRVTYNNTRGFNKWWEAGGMKFIGNGGLNDSRVEGNTVTHNFGDGIWFDWGNDNNRIEKNVVAYNQGFGIHYEASLRGHIASNKVFGNSQRGIYLPHSRDSVVTDNLVAANGLEGVVIIDEQRRDDSRELDLRPNNNKVIGNVIAWNRGIALILPGAQYQNASNRNVYIHDTPSTPQFAMGWPKLWNHKKSLAAWRTQTHQDQASVTRQVLMSQDIQLALERREINVEWPAFTSVQPTLAAAEKTAATPPETLRAEAR